jgi:hypothetical protein
MKVTFSGLMITDGTGKIGGNTIQNSRFGKVARINVRPTVVNRPNFNYNSEKQFFREIVSNWRNLATSDRLSWNPATPTGKSGFNYYVQQNLTFYRYNGTFLTSKPLTGVPPTNTAMSYGVDHATGIGTFNVTGDVTSGGYVWNLYTANNFSPGVAICRKSAFRLVLQPTTVVGFNAFTFSAKILEINILQKSKCFLKAVLLDPKTGILSAPLYFSAIAT